jgi:hypothetical protein
MDRRRHEEDLTEEELDVLEQFVKATRTGSKQNVVWTEKTSIR